MGDLVITIDQLEDAAWERSMAAWEATTGAMLRREYGAETVQAHRGAFQAEVRTRLAPIFEAMRMGVRRG